MFLSCHVKEPCIALTFDDGPTAELTPRLLDILDGHGAKATLFFIGQRAAELPEVVRDAMKRGHEVANHTWSHPHLTQLNAEEAGTEIERTSQLLADIAGERPAVFRPPFIDTNEALNQRIRQEFGMEVISGDVHSNDWTKQEPEKTITAVMEATQAGSIIICHENQPNTIEALPELLRRLKEKGFQLVTVSNLMAMERNAASR